MKHFKPILLPVLGAAGAVFAIASPAYYKAVCGGLPFPGLSLPLGG